MSVIVPRTCTEIPKDDTGLSDGPVSRPLGDLRDESAYVLLGDPGSGKSTAFEAECSAMGDDACLVTARDFLTFDPSDHPEWRDRTLFIDGLDEVRAGSVDARTPFDGIRRKLDLLGRLRFRLSCREADWLGNNDRSSLARVAPAGRVVVLRLDPLTDQDVERILAGRSDIREDAAAFIANANEKGVGGFLGNPQSLDLLARAVGRAGSWPTSRLELFEAACWRMVREHNEEHVAAARSLAAAVAVADGLTEEALLNTAGRLCAVQVVASVAGFAVTENDRSEDYPVVDTCCLGWDGTHATGRRTGSRLGQLRAVRATKLFSARASGSQRFTPLHRHVAEFLGARYLARLIGDDGTNRGSARGGVPCRRVIAMMTGYDGMVVTELRGLSAWLAAQCPRARGDLIERDPVGVTLYGDAAGFSTAEKVALLKSLAESGGALAERLAASSRYPAQSASAAGPLVATVVEPQQAPGPVSAAGSLVTSDTKSTIRDILTSSRRDEAHQTFVLFVLRALPHGARLPGLTDALLELIRDDRCWPGVRRRALDALLRNGMDGDGQELVNSLSALLADVHAGRVEDPQDELLGTLLARLYPEALPPSRVWDYLPEAEGSLFGGRFIRFWITNVAERCPDADVAEHLDRLAARQVALRPALDSRGLHNVPVRLLARGLAESGDEIEAPRLYDWLGVAIRSKPRGDSTSEESLGSVRSWLARRPAIQKAILDEGLKRCAEGDSSDFRKRWFEVERRFQYPDFVHAALPADFGVWCLNQAEALADTRPQIADYLLRRAMNAVAEWTGDAGSTLEVLESRVQRHDVLRAVYADLQADDERAERQLERYERDHQRRGDEAEQQHQKQLDIVRSHEAALRENRCPPALLHQLALAYFGLLIEANGNTPTDRLRSLFRGDERLKEAALVGLRGTVFRADLPTVDEVISLRDRRMEHYLALPALASLEELEKETPTDLRRLNTSLLRAELACHYCTGGLDEPRWFRTILDSQPELVAEVLIYCAAPELRKGREHVSGLYELAYVQAHAQVARIASLPLLRAFPIRCAARQMTDLSYLLWSALRHAERDALLDLIERKLSRASMDVAQRARWLAAGLILSPKTYLAPAEEFAAGGERRIRHLFALFEDQPLERFPVERLAVPVLKLLIRRAGSTYRPWEPAATGGVREVTPEMSAAERVQWMIRGLAELPTAEVGDALEALASDPALAHWKAELIRARDDQRVVRRDAAYCHPDVEQVCRTLNDGPPANASDLAALVMDRLDEIAGRIRNGNTDDWRQYWNEDSHSRPLAPKPENSCRDALLSDLRQCLPDEVDAQPEGQYANDKRADIRISCRDFQVPVEVKKNDSRDLWSALRDQLIGQYVRDPATDGYGIYLVLWFGEVDEDGRKCTPLPPSGGRPDEPGALRARLESMLSSDEARKISVCVIDVSAERYSSASPSAP